MVARAARSMPHSAAAGPIDPSLCVVTQPSPLRTRLAGSDGPLRALLSSSAVLGGQYEGICLFNQTLVERSQCGTQRCEFNTSKDI